MDRKTTISMTTDFVPNSFFNNLSLPANDISKLSFCGSSKTAKVKSWVDGLRATQIAQTSAILYRTVPELTRLKTDPETRFEMLEAVRPSVQHCIQGLTKEFLNQPVVLPDNAQKAAIVAQALQKYMVDGYVTCVRDIVTKSRQNARALDILTKSVHRSITGIGLVFLRNFQLYTPTPRGLWLLIHSLHRTGCYYELEKKPVADAIFDLDTASSIDNSYVKVLLMATAGCSQINQKDVDTLFKAVSIWSSLVKLNKHIPQDGENLFIVNQSQDAPPGYKKRFTGSEFDYVLEMDIRSLIAQLNKQGGNTGDIIATKGKSGLIKDFPESLLTHLLEVWVNVAERKQHRKNTRAVADICIGLVDCHYFISDLTSFDSFISQNSEASDWQSDIGRNFSTDLSRDKYGIGTTGPERPSFRVTVQNASSGGFCLLWQGEIPARIEAGEIVGLKEAGKRSWSVGVVRWIRQMKKASQLGIQMLSDLPKTCGAAQIYDMGGYSDYMRAIVLPPFKMSNLGTTLLTAKAPFQEMSKAKLMNGQKITTIKLDKCIFSTGSIKQFSFHSLDAINPSRDESNKRGSSFDSWDD